MANRLFLTAAMLFSITYYNAQNSWEWARQGVSSGLDASRDITTDAMGNVYVCGTYNGTLTLGSFVLSGAGQTELYVAKYDPNGTVLWAKTASNPQADYANAICVDLSGNVYVTGEFAGTSITFGSFTLTGNADIFLVKYDASGNEQWARKAGGTNAEQGYDVACDLSGNVYITGYFKSVPCYFDTVMLNGHTSTASDFFLAKYDGSGNILWAREAGGTVYDKGYSVTTDGVGNVYVSGMFASTSITFGTFSLSNSGPSASAECFVVRYNPDGTVAWAKSYGGSADDEANGIASDSSGSVYFTGTFLSGSINIGTTTLNSSDGFMFTAKLDTSGNELWAHAGGGTLGYQSRNSIACDGMGNAYSIGTFADTVVYFGSDSVVNTPGGGSNFFVVKYDPTGNVSWALGFGGIGAEECSGVAARMDDEVIVDGSFTSDTLIMGPDTLLNTGSYDCFVGKTFGGTLNVQAINNAPAGCVFPNPCQDEFRIDFSNENTPIVTLTLFDLFGQPVRTIERYSSGTSVATEGLPNGIYSYTLTAENSKVVSGKLVIAR